MKVFVASKAPKQLGEGEFAGTVEGELVVLPPDICDCPDCGCQGAVVGLASAGASTRFEVIDHPTMTSRQYLQAVSDGLARQGYIESDPACFAFGHLDMAKRFAPGVLLEVEDGRIRVRSGNTAPHRQAST